MHHNCRFYHLVFGSKLVKNYKKVVKIGINTKIIVCLLRNYSFIKQPQITNMKTTPITSLGFVVLLLLSLSAIAWKKDGSGLPVKLYSICSSQDTLLPGQKLKAKNEYKTEEIDNAMKELDHAMLEMKKNLKLDFNKMDKELKAAMAEIKNIDFEKVGREVEATLKKVDWDKTSREINKAVREVDFKIKEIDMKQIEKELARAKIDIEAAKMIAKIDREMIKRSIEKGLAEARIGIEKAKKELSLMKEFTETLEKEGLINRKKGYQIEIKNGEMIINGNKQSKEINDQYRKYFKDENYTIKSDGEDVSRV